VDLAGALLSWLVAKGGGAAVRGVRLLLGDVQQQALAKIVASATQEVAERADGLDQQQREHLRAVLNEGRGAPGGVRVWSEADLRAALAGWAAVLDRPQLGGDGYLSTLGLRADRVGDDLANAILIRVQDDARRGGPLGPVADWLWRDGISGQLHDLCADVQGLMQRANRVETAVGASVAPPGAGGVLPGEVEYFVGRTAALAQLRERVGSHGPVGVVVVIHAITGMAGVGKTALAVHAAHEHAAGYPDGQFFVDLCGYTAGVQPLTPDGALDDLLRQAGLAGQEIPAGLAARQAAWRRLLAGRRALVVLDNARDSAQVRPLLPMAPGCLVLVTSRSRLVALTEATPLPLDVLALPEAATMFATVVGSDRCPDPGDVDRVVLAVGQLPLAVRIAAGRLLQDRTATVGRLAAELEDTRRRLDELSPEQAGVRAAFMVSLGRLDWSQQLAYWMVGLHPGPTLTPPVLAALADVPAARAASLLRDLCDLNLLDPVAQGEDRAVRYESHDLVRDHARELASIHLSQPEQLAALDRLAAFYAELAGSGDWRRVMAERNNLVSFAQAHRAASAAATFQAAAHSLLDTGYYRHSASLYQAAHDICTTIGDRLGQADALLGLGHLDRLTGQYDSARTHHRNTLDIHTVIGDPRGQADALRGLGVLDLLTGQCDSARTYFHNALDIHTAVGNRQGQAKTLYNLGELDQVTGQYDSARTHYHNALDIYTAIGDRQGQAYALLSLGYLDLAGVSWLAEPTLMSVLVRDGAEGGLVYDLSGLRRKSFGG